MNLKDIDLQWYIDYDSDTYYNCDENDCDSICRCGKIENVVFNSVNVTEIANTIYNSMYDATSLVDKRDIRIEQVLSGLSKDVKLYVIDRILRKYKIWDQDTFEVDICGGYYGEEMQSITISTYVANKIEGEIYAALNLGGLKETVEYLLMMEYGSILPELEYCDYEFEVIKRSDIIFGNIQHLKNVKEKSLDFYEDSKYDGIRSVVIKKDDKYRLIDGYHRTYSTEKDDIKVLIAKKVV